MNYYLLSIICFLTCSQTTTVEEAHTLMNPNAKYLSGRINCNTGYQRLKVDSNSFTYYLRNLPLKHSDSLVRYYNGNTKQKREVYCAVVDMPISKQDLQQCADAVMRLRAEYLYKQKKYADISFRFVGDGKMHTYLSYVGSDYSYLKFRKYMEHVFSFANTASLKKQLKSIPFYKMQAGDVLVKTGNPYGHAVMVVDVSTNAKGEKEYLLAQSYMPAQETQILLNPATSTPWYGKPSGSVISTPEWTFDSTDLHRW